jgi:pilus assembly protein CpaB
MAKILNKNWLLLAGAIGLGAVAFYLSNSVISNRMKQIEDELRSKKEEVSVIVAARNMAAGEVIDKDSAAVRSFPKEFVHASALSPEEFEKIGGDALLIAVRAGEPLLPVYTVTRGGAFFSGSVPDGRRALTIEVDELSSIAGMVRAGDHIDLIMTAKPPTNANIAPGSAAESYTFPLLSYMEVLATGRAQRGSGGNVESYNTVTLNVTPQQANIIIAAKAGSKVTAILRGPKDQIPNPSQATSVNDVVASMAKLNKINSTEYIIGGRGGSTGASNVISVPVSVASQAFPTSLSNQIDGGLPKITPIK